MFDRAQAIDEGFLNRVKAGDFATDLPSITVSQAGLSAEMLVELFETQVISRHLDLIARRSKGKTYYSIGSSGHEGLAAVAKAARQDDMAFLHYRDGAFLVQRKRQQPGEAVLYDMMLSLAASSDDPVSGGRHKVLGGKDVMVPPQTSTIASHLPKAMGTAHGIGLARKLAYKDALLPEDSVVICSFGDASTNHSTAQGALNAAAWAAYQNAPMPIVFICEDNNIGISVRTPEGWIEASCKTRPGLKYMTCDGTSLPETYSTAQAAFQYARSLRKPVFLHMKTVRLMGHAGADIEAAYTNIAHIEQVEANDPLLRTAQLLLAEGVLQADEIIALYEKTRAQVARVAQEAFSRPQLTTAEQVMAPIVPPVSGRRPPPLPNQARRKALFAKDARQMDKPQALARHITWALADLMAQYSGVVVFGEDVGRKGGVYSVTTGLQEKYGPARVMDTLLDEQSILGTAIGLGQNGFLPIPEIQFLAYLHNAEDQLRGEAATLSFFSNGQFTNPMVVRIAGLAYQRGFGGHFHNDNSFAVLRDIPGLIIACPSNGADGAKMLRECVRLAHEEQRVVVFLEPIALYMTTDLHEEGDGQWAALYQGPLEADTISLGDVGIHGVGTDLCILTYGNGTYLSRKAEKILRDSHGLGVRIVDLRWLAPLNQQAIIAAAETCAHVLVVDECRETASLGEQIVTTLWEHNVAKPLARVSAKDSFIPLGPAAYTVLPSVEDIVREATKLCGVK